MSYFPEIKGKLQVIFPWIVKIFILKFAIWHGFADSCILKKKTFNVMMGNTYTLQFLPFHSPSLVSEKQKE